MTTVESKIGAFDAQSAAVPVTFTSGTIIHKRRVNAVLNEDGSYNRAATKLRVDEVALGVAYKIANGAISSEPQPE